MSAYVPSSAFQAAAAYMSGAPSLSALSDTIRLELYGLYKYLVVSPIPSTSRPSIFDFTGRAKWDAWRSIGQKYGDRENEAEERYLAIARGLGWSEDATVEQPSTSQEEEDIWDDESVEASRQSGGLSMGNSVSVMAQPEDENSPDAVSNIAISGTAEDMESFLRANTSFKVDTKDVNGYTPLHLACDRGNIGVADILIQRGASWQVPDPDGYSAEELAEIADQREIVDLIGRAKKV
ncbi:acyl CoA binding protein-domain-containing protein [Sparassis latifolia]